MLRSGDSFVAFVDAVGELDSTTCVLEWKTSSARYPEEPDGIVALDRQPVCYSWLSGIQEVAQVVFVHKRAIEVRLAVLQAGWGSSISVVRGL
jgi:hypothetical protein